LNRHWRKGVLGTNLVLLSSLLTFPQPLHPRSLVDNVILEKQLDQLSGVVLLMGLTKIMVMAA
jgi:hypothetical protein